MTIRDLDFYPEVLATCKEHMLNDADFIFDSVDEVIERYVQGFVKSRLEIGQKVGVISQEMMRIDLRTQVCTPSFVNEVCNRLITEAETINSTPY